MNAIFDYDTTYLGPAFPILTLEIKSGINGKGENATALIDTGSDATAVPHAILQRIGARKLDSRWVRTINNVRYRTDVYVVSAVISGYLIPNIEAIANYDTEELIIGRDILNQLVITLDGFAQTTTITD